MSNIIRQATLADIKQLAILFDLYRIFYEKPTDIQAAQDFLSARITKSESVIFVTAQDNSLTGFVQLYPIFSSTRMQRLWLLNDLFVAETHRGQGLSVMLINECKRWCKDTAACGLILETAKSNDIGNQLYPRMGFEVDNNHNYYSWDLI